MSRGVPALVASCLVVLPAPDHARQESVATVAVRALGPDGGLVRNLTAGDVVIELNGNRREVRSLQLVASTGDGADALPPPFVTNAVLSPRRRLLIYVDEESLNPGDQGAVQSGIATILGGLRAGDLVGLTSPRGSGIVITPTTDHARVREAASSLAGLRSPNNRCQFPDVLRHLATVFGALADDVPTTVVFFSGGVDQGYPCDARRIRDEMRPLGQAAQAGALDFYVVHVFASSGQTADPELLENLAGVTTAEFIRLAAERTDVLERIADETGAYYTVTFASPARAGDESTGPRRLEIRTTRSDVQLRGQRWLRTIEAPTAAPGVTALGPALRSPGEFRDLKVRARVLASPNAGDSRVRLLAMFEILDDAEVTAAMVGVFDAEGVAMAQWSARAEELKRPITLAALPVAPGRYRVRIAAAAADGRIGTVDQVVDADIRRGGTISASDIVLGVLDQGSLSPRFEFRDEATATAYLELNDVPANAEVLARIEVLTASGEVLPSQSVSQPSIRPGATETYRIVHAGLDLSSLSAGDYQVRVRVTVSGADAATRSVTLRKGK